MRARDRIWKITVRPPRWWERCWRGEGRHIANGMAKVIGGKVVRAKAGTREEAIEAVKTRCLEETVRSVEGNAEELKFRVPVRKRGDRLIVGEIEE